jgi:negative regulator of flagellin synthesis FlgM
MRIEAYTQVQQTYNTNKTSKSQKSEKPSLSDQVQISSFGKDIQTAKQAVANSPDIREEITAPLKENIQSGTYSVSGQKFADKLLEKYNESETLA